MLNNGCAPICYVLLGGAKINQDRFISSYGHDNVLGFDISAEKRRRGIRRTALIAGLVALFFYIGFIVLTIVRGSR